MGGFSLYSSPDEMEEGRKKVQQSAIQSMRRKQFDEDLATAKRDLYMKRGDPSVYSAIRGLGPGMAARRLEEHGVDVEGLVGNRPTDSDYKKGGKVSSASKRADGIAQRGKTRGKMR